MKTILQITVLALVLLAILVFSRIIGGVVGENLAKSQIASRHAQTERAKESLRSAWIYTHNKNAMTGVVTKKAWVGDHEMRLERFSTSTGESGLHLRANPFRVCSNPGEKCNVLVRFEDQEPKRFRVHYQAGNDTTTFDSHELIFSSLTTAKRMRVSRDPYPEGGDFLEFDVSGFDEHATSVPEDEASVEAMNIEYSPEQLVELAALATVQSAENAAAR